MQHRKQEELEVWEVTEVQTESLYDWDTGRDDVEEKLTCTQKKISDAELCSEMHSKLVKNLRVGIRGEAEKDVLVGICHRLPGWEEEMDEQWKKKKKASQMQALIFLGNCSHLNICWSVNRMGWKQSRRFWSVLPIIFDAGAGQTVYGKVLLHMLLTSMEELVGGRCQGCWQPWLQKDHGVQDLERSEEGK